MTHKLRVTLTVLICRQAFSPTYLPAHSGQNPLPLHPLVPSIVGIGSGHSYGNTYNTLVFPDAGESQYALPSNSAQQS